MSTTVTQKTHWKKFFNYDYLGTYSLPDGKDLILTISHVTKEMVTGGSGQKEECMILYFTDSEKPMILNRTNSKAITEIYGTPYVEEWTGYQIQLYAQGGIKAFGSVTEGLRIRRVIPAAPSKAEKEIEELQAKIRKLLTTYKGDDRKNITEGLKKNRTDKKYLKEAIKILSK